MPSAPSRPRYDFLDAFRGFLVVNMIAFHFCWDLVFLKGVDWAWYRDFTLPARFWQTFIRFFFILLSGYCLNLSNHPLRRGLELTACGAVITFVTLIAMPEDAIIFGVLTFLGAATFVGTPVRKKNNGGTALSAICLFVSLLLYILFRGVSYGFIGIMFHPLIRLPSALYRGYFMTFLGFIAPFFHSTDYVPLLPWIFVYFMGFFLGRITLPVINERLSGNGKNHNSDSSRPRGDHSGRLPEDGGNHGSDSPRPCDDHSGRLPEDEGNHVRAKTPASYATAGLRWIGRHSLLIYMVHQPILAGITYLLMIMK
ncbi:MAG: heparan-alpha-glucosaminide N-acetyltransferase [Lachnospiraceae bacterium]|nr:heparan-alpha-glucosaminide N-acetyltransferase [Lachnospiraceae bacterium]